MLVNFDRNIHIHGDANVPASIALGYEHYSGYLQQMRNYVVSGTGTSYKQKFEPIIKKLRKEEYQSYSWLDLFFTHDIHIIGLTLDFIEIHLWWLLTYIQRVKLMSKLNTTNRIFYYYPSPLELTIKNKLDLLKSNGVALCSIPYDNKYKQKFYMNIIRKIRKNKI